MKTTRLEFLLVICLLGTTAHAQFLRGYGIKAGVVSANQDWQYTSLPNLATDTRWGFIAAGFVEMFELPFFSLVSELQYAQKGMSFTAPITTPSQPEGTGQFMTIRPRVDYLSIPVLANSGGQCRAPNSIFSQDQDLIS